MFRLQISHSCVVACNFIECLLCRDSGGSHDSKRIEYSSREGV